jgi:hypothetical protein
VRRKGDRRGDKRPSALAAAVARLGLWLAAFALLAQSFAIAAPPMFDGADPHSAAAELQALLGPSVVICTQANPAGPQHHPFDCHDQCPLCRLVANAALLSVPAAEPLPAPALALSGKLGFAPQPPTYAPRPSGFSLARGPPSQT